jgi:hypothetical protein
MKTRLLLCLLLCAAPLASPADKALKTFRGEISDSQCAMNVHSLNRTHDAMIKNKSMGTDAASCSRNCVKQNGGDFVLLVKDRVYRLDDQVKAEQFAGEQVVIRGKLDSTGKIIQLNSIRKQ